MMETIEGVDVAVDFEPFYQFINSLGGFMTSNELVDTESLLGLIIL